MKFLKRQKKVKKVCLVISDLHLGAGSYINGRMNSLEDFHADEELIDFLNFHSSGDYASKEVELIINGDFLDLLAVPFVTYFDDEYWSEEASLKKLELILEAHSEVMDALNKFVSSRNKKIIYIIGNHDGELVFDKLKECFLSTFDDTSRERVILTNEIEEYCPVKGVYIKHGHQYEKAHLFSMKDSIITSESGQKYFLPPWGSYYVTHIINRYKQERDHINAVRPVGDFIIHGLIFDTFFIIRFLFANAYYFFMVRFLYYFRQKKSFKELVKDISSELGLFKDYKVLTREFFSERPAKVLIVGHTHEPLYQEYLDGSIFINTGTWTQMVSLDLKSLRSELNLTFARVDIYNKEFDLADFHINVQVKLNSWRPRHKLPYFEWR